MLSLMDGYSSPARFWFGNKLYIGVYEPEQIKVCIKNIARYININLLAYV